MLWNTFKTFDKKYALTLFTDLTGLLPTGISCFSGTYNELLNVIGVNTYFIGNCCVRTFGSGSLGYFWDHYCNNKVLNHYDRLGSSGLIATPNGRASGTYSGFMIFNRFDTNHPDAEYRASWIQGFLITI